MKLLIKNIYGILVLCSLLVLPACNNEDFFEFTNPPETPWLTVTDLEMAAAAPYNIAFGDSWGNFSMDDRLIFDCMADVLYLLPGTAANIPYNEMYNRSTNVEIDKTKNGFKNAYLAIGAINNSLDFLKTNNYNPFPSATELERENIKRIKGELFFMRAWSYFSLVVKFAPAPGSADFDTKEVLPYRDHFASNLEEANSVSFASGRKIYDLILADLDSAKKLLPLSFASGTYHPSYQFGRVNRYAAAMMLARVNMQLGEYNSALPELDFVISGPYNLDQDPIEAFSHSDSEKGNEVIWYALYYDKLKGSTPKTATSFNYSDYRAINGGRGDYNKRCVWNQFPLSHKVSTEVGWMDESLKPTASAIADKRYTQLYYRLEGNRGNSSDNPIVYEMQYSQIKQPFIWGDKYFRGEDGQFTNVPMMRLAEAYLSRAILTIDTDPAKAAADLNVVRKRAYNESVAGVPFENSPMFVTAATITKDMIHQERLKELACEGDRYLYLMALKLPIPAGDRETQAIPYPYEGLQWRLPQAELDFKGE